MIYKKKFKEVGLLYFFNKYNLTFNLFFVILLTKNTSHPPMFKCKTIQTKLWEY